MHRSIVATLLFKFSVSLLAAPAAWAQQQDEPPPRRFTLSLRATAQQYDIRLSGYPFGRRRAVLRPVQFAAAYQLSKQFSIQTGAAWHTTKAENQHYLNSQGQLVEARQDGLLSVGVPLLLRYAFLPHSPEHRWNGYALAGFTALLTRTTLIERTVSTGQDTKWTNGQLALMLTLGQARATGWGRTGRPRPRSGFAARPPQASHPATLGWPRAWPTGCRRSQLLSPVILSSAKDLIPFRRAVVTAALAR